MVLQCGNGGRWKQYSERFCSVSNDDDCHVYHDHDFVNDDDDCSDLDHDQDVVHNDDGSDEGILFKPEF